MTGTLTAPAMLSDRDVETRRASRGEALSDRDLLWSPMRPLEVVVGQIEGPQLSMYLAIGEPESEPLVKVVEPLDAAAPRWFETIAIRAAQLLTLPDEWDTYGSSRVNPRAVEYAMRLLLLASTTNTPSPSLVPLADGGVQIEWHVEGADLEVEVAANGSVSVYSEGVEGDEWESEFLPAVERLENLVAEFS